MYFRIVLISLTMFSWSYIIRPALAEDLPKSCVKTTKTNSIPKLKKLYLQCAKEVPEGGYRSLAYINLGTIFFREGNFSVAANYYDLADVGVGSVSSDPLFHAYRASTYNKIGRGDEAVRDADKVVDWLKSNDTNNIQLLKELVEKIIPIYYQNNRPESFQLVLRFYIGLKDNDWIDYLNKSSVLSAVDRYDDAIVFAKKAIDMQPNHPATLNSYCYVLAKSGEPAKALPYCEKALKIEPDRAEIWHSQAFVLAEMGKCKESEKSRLQAKKLQPRDKEYMNPLPCH